MLLLYNNLQKVLLPFIGQKKQETRTQQMPVSCFFDYKNALYQTRKAHESHCQYTGCNQCDRYALHCLGHFV